MGVKRRARTERRERERETRKLVRARQELSLREPGGAADSPIEVDSSSVIEVRARALRCPLCAGEYIVDSHDAALVDGRSLRVLRVHCRLCGVPRSLWFRIGTPLAN